MSVTASDPSQIKDLKEERGIKVTPVFRDVPSSGSGITEDPTLVWVEIEVETAELAEGRIRQLVGDDVDISTARRFLDYES